MNGFTIVLAIAFWVMLAVIAVVNGYIAQAYFAPRFGEYATHVYKSVAAMLAIFALAGFYAQLTQGPAWVVTAFSVGLLWIGLTTAFEFLVGHYVFGHSWDTLLADYRVWEGRLWLLVLIATAIAPLLMARLLNP